MLPQFITERGCPNTPGNVELQRGPIGRSTDTDLRTKIIERTVHQLSSRASAPTQDTPIRAHPECLDQRV